MTPRFVGESARLAGLPLLRCQTDGRLVDLVRAGNERAFEAIVDRYRRPLLRYCARLLPPARAEDAVQQTFLNAYAAMQRGDAELDLRPWLYRIARNACLNALRENGWSYEQIEELRRGTESAYDVAERRSELREVVAAVHTLPARQREAVVLRELEGRTYDQIASEMHSSEGAVRQLLNRARNTLRAGATALTPVALLARLSWPHNQPVVAQVSDAGGHEAVRSGAARLGGAVAAAIALAVGVTEAPRHLFGSIELRKALREPESLPPLSASAPRAPAADLRASRITRTTSAAAPELDQPWLALRAATPTVGPAIARVSGTPGTELETLPAVTPVPPEPPRSGRSRDRDDLIAREGRRGTPERVSWTRDRGRDWGDGRRRRTARRHTALIVRYRTGRRRATAAKSDPHPRGARAEHADRPEHNVAAPKHKADRPQKHNGKRKGNRRKGKKG